MNNLKHNSLQTESFIAISRLVLVILGAGGYFVLTEKSEFNFLHIILIIAAFYYSVQIVFHTHAMGRVPPGWVSAGIDSLFVWLFVWR